MSYELLLVPKAEVQVDHIVRYLSVRSSQGALAWCERWEQILADMRKLSRMGSPRSGNPSPVT